MSSLLGLYDLDFSRFTFSSYSYLVREKDMLMPKSALVVG